MCFIWCICLFEETLDQMQADMHQPSHSQDSRKSSIGCGAVWEKKKQRSVLLLELDVQVVA